MLYHVILCYVIIFCLLSFGFGIELFSSFVVECPDPNGKCGMVVGMQNVGVGVRVGVACGGLPSLGLT